MPEATKEQPQRPHPWKVEGAPPGTPGSPGTQPGGPKRPRSAWLRFGWVLILLLVINWIVSSFLLRPPERTHISYTFFVTQVQAANVKDITSTGDTIEGDFKASTAYTDNGQTKSEQVTRFTTQRPSFAGDNLLAQLQANGVPVNANPPDAPAPVWQQLLVGFGPTILLVGLLFWVGRRMASGLGGGGLGSFGRSRAKLYQPESGPRTTFADVAGIEEVEQEVTEIVDFLREPEKYRKLGAQIPHGVLLSGPPGTGKTLLARAVAGEARVPFFSMSASEFIEAIVGIGASRVRDLFTQAKNVAPSIIFIDELDAIGRSRGSATSIGGNDEREQTLNQILTEMDGFTGSEGVVVLAATNRAEILDQALLRPGRFDRRVTVSPPDLAGREAILRVHTRGVPVAPGVDLQAIASATPGMVGADLKNLVNEAALLAARRGHAQVQTPDFTDALEKIMLGTVRGIMLTSEEKERTAFHESGHALLGMLTPGADPVRKISIIPRGQALGVTFQSPDTDRYGYSAKYLRGRIIGALGGRAAEEVVFGDMTTGAESDLDQVSNIARQMVGRWGMSDAIGPVTVLPPPGQESPFGNDNVAPATKELIDAEVRKIVDDCYEEALSLLREHRDQLNSLANKLLETETLDSDDAYAAAGIDRATAPNAIARGETPGTTPAPGIPAPAASSDNTPNPLPATSA
ncbi:ATP-dependent zinc metalloprotease FtsH [Actinoplanes sp. TBRC 11911]|uniref:ATP-dependent zinc metalloprotease FtsH n=1 Tax=Actinoplanes sp. TBRC 11911 TaxID=2729386 RepID=UPI001B7D5613|nr:ATP-dependent zinc metalloprotease FtsH [Actinoplanes sp. TBRC 11911]